ncbi:unnamed protein product [Ambrosiozyma monospora]|uniref:Unnamed protein product n=1 Tax=Ambrosiozyma monospora TaxID=43982 RepID=A0A9W6YS69_AMBMO|nr:unnamed protein product [Ambrosiozyma monospora]
MFKKSNYKLLHTKLNTTKINSIISYWDSTITNIDTTPLVFQAIPKSCFYQYPYFYKIYGDAYKQYMNEVLPLKEEFRDRKNVFQECLFQRDFNHVECSSWNECVQKQVFKDVDRNVFQRLGQKVASGVKVECNEFHVKEGFVEFWNWFTGLKEEESLTKLGNGDKLSHGSYKPEFRILSVGWSMTLIESYFKYQFSSTSTELTEISKLTASPRTKRALPTQMILNEFEFDQNTNVQAKLIQNNNLK